MVATIRIEITGDASSAQRAAERTASSYDKFGDSMDKLAGPATVAVGAVALIGKTAIDAAAEAQQAIGGVEAVFGQAADKIKSASQGSADAVGLSTAAYQQLAAGVGGAMTGMGVSVDDAAASTQDLVQRGADLASVFGGTTAQAVEAMTSAFRGEYDGLQRLIPAMSAAAVEQQMAADAAAGLTFATEDQAKAHAITAAIMAKSTDAAGNFAKESDTASGAAERSKAAYENAMAALGEKLLPVVTDVTTALSGMATWIADNSTLVLTLGGIVGGLGAAILAVIGVMKVIEIAQAAWTAVQLIGTAVTGGLSTATAALSTAMAFLAANPIILVIAAIVAIIAAIVLLWNKSDAFREFIIGMWDAITAAASACWEAIKAAAGAVWDWITGKATEAGEFITGIWDAIKSAAGTAWEWIKSLVTGVWDGIKTAISSVSDWILGIWEDIKSVGVSTWNAIKSAVDALLTPFRAVRDAVQWLIDKLKMAWDWAVKVISKIPFVGDMVGAGTVSAPLAVSGYGRAAPLTAGPATRSAGGGGGVVINVNGALDPVAVAQQIEALLRNQRRRTRGVSVGGSTLTVVT